ncbi:MAG: DUF4270 family protein [Bacteroidota bacterium]|nr:DUF4270 family protein [Bacteroidota bacterium]
MHKFTLFIGLFFYVVLSACSEGPLSIGKELVYSPSDVIVTDTFSISTYTVKVDSIQTSGYEKALVGNYTDGYFGNITAKSFFEIAPPAPLTIPRYSAFDSIVLISHFTNYWYGDSTKPFTMEVHELTQKLEDLKNTSGYICNTKEATYSSVILGQATISHTFPDFHIRLSDSWGQRLFQLIDQGDSIITNSVKFGNTYKGLALIPSVGTNSSIIRFAAADTSCYVRLYYKNEKNGHVDFKINNGNLQFNSIKTDLSNSPLKSLKYLTDRVASEKTGGLSFAQTGTGIMTRMEFPTIRRLTDTDKKIRIISASLILSPVEGIISLPSSLNFYNTDYNNNFNIKSPLSNSSTGAVITSTPYIDPMHTQSSYSVDITSFIADEITTISSIPPALLVSVPLENSTTLERLILASPKQAVNPTRLRITYWRY